jgi:hypothetical protein
VFVKQFNILNIQRLSSLERFIYFFRSAVFAHAENCNTEREKRRLAFRNPGAIL